MHFLRKDVLTRICYLRFFFIENTKFSVKGIGFALMEFFFRYVPVLTGKNVFKTCAVNYLIRADFQVMTHAFDYVG